MKWTPRVTVYNTQFIQSSICTSYNSNIIRTKKLLTKIDYFFQIEPPTFNNNLCTSSKSIERRPSIYDLEPIRQCNFDRERWHDLNIAHLSFTDAFVFTWQMNPINVNKYKRDPAICCCCCCFRHCFRAILFYFFRNENRQQCHCLRFLVSHKSCVKTKKKRWHTGHITTIVYTEAACCDLPLIPENFCYAYE